MIKQNWILLLGLTITAIFDWQFISAFSYAAFGGPIGGAIMATGLTLSITMWQKKIENQKSIENIKRALLVEINSLEERWNFSIGGVLQPLKEGELPPMITVYIQEDYFVVYNSNADKIGMLNLDLAELVVSFYQNAKAFVDTMRTWREMLGNLSLKLRAENRSVFSIEEKTGLVNYYNMMLGQQNEVFEQGYRVKIYLDK